MDDAADGVVPPIALPRCTSGGVQALLIEGRTATHALLICRRDIGPDPKTNCDCKFGTAHTWGALRSKQP